MNHSLPAPPLLRYELFDAPGLVHAITTRQGGYSQGHCASLNLGHTVGDDPHDVDRNHELVFSTLGFGADQVITAHQVAGQNVAVVDGGQAGSVLPCTDGLICATPGLLLMLRYADCVPVMLWDPTRHAIGVVHAGWRGTVQGIAAHAAQSMAAAFGCRPDDLRAVIGPAIGPCCFEVGPEVPQALEEAFDAAAGAWITPGQGDRTFVDLWQANAWQLRHAGVGRVHVDTTCTRCHRDRFYSHRGDGGRTGRFAALIGMRPVGVKESRR